MNTKREAVLVLWSEGWADEDIAKVLEIEIKEEKRILREMRKKRA